MDSMDSDARVMTGSGFLAEWLEALRHASENPVAGWLLTARERRLQRLPMLRKLLMPGLVSLLFIGIFLYYASSSPQLLSGTALELVVMLVTIGVLPGVMIWCLTGVFQAVQESYSLLADESRSKTALTIDDMVSVSSMSNADIAVGALQVIMPPLFWRSFGMSLGLWWMMLMLTSMFGTDLRSEAFVSSWTWGIVSFSLLLVSSMLASLALVLGCIAAGLRSHGSLVPLTSAMLIMVGTLAWFFIGGRLLVNDEHVVPLTSVQSIYGAVAFLVVSMLLALLLRGKSGARSGLGVVWPMLGAIMVWAYFRFVVGHEDTLGETLSYALGGFVRSIGSFSLLNPLFIPSPASWGDVFMRNTVTGSSNFGGSLELRWLIGFLTQLGLVWINAWLAWHSISSKRST